MVIKTEGNWRAFIALQLKNTGKTILLMFSAVVSVFGQPEVIRVSDIYNASKYVSTLLMDGGLAVDDQFVYLASEGGVYKQEKLSPKNAHLLQFDIKHKELFKPYSFMMEKDKLTVFFFAPNGRYYLCTTDMNGSFISGPISRNSGDGKIIRAQDGELVVAGLYRPQYVPYLDKYDDESGFQPTELSKRMFKQLYETSSAFFVSFYDDSLNLVDSLNVLSLKGEHARAYENLFLPTPMDIDDKGNVLIIDHVDGYDIKIINPETREETRITIWNEHFNPIPIELNTAVNEALKSKSGSYSKTYALYVTQGHILTSFYQNSSGRGPIDGPYHLDVITRSGAHKLSSVVNYPAVAKGPSDKIFFLIVRDGGWLGKDEIYLVGMTIPEIINGMARKEVIDAAIDSFNNLPKK